MLDLNKKNRYVLDLISNSYFSTKIEIYMSVKTIGEDFDPYEKKYDESNLNPHFIKGYVREVKASTLIWKPYGLSEIGMIEIICDEKYGDWFRNCNLVKVNGNSYQVWKEAQGNRVLVESRPCGMVRVTLKKVV